MNISPINNLSFSAKWTINRNSHLDKEGNTGKIVDRIEKKLSSKKTNDFINRLPENGDERIEFDYYAFDETTKPVLALRYIQNERNKITHPIKDEDTVCIFSRNDANSKKEISDRIDNWLHTIGKHYSCY